MGLERRLELERKRGELVARSAMLREQLAYDMQPVARTLAVADRVRDGFRWLMAHPQWLIPLVALPIVLRPRRAFALAWRLFTGWRVWKRTRELIVSLERR